MWIINSCALAHNTLPLTSPSSIHSLNFETHVGLCPRLFTFSLDKFVSSPTGGSDDNNGGGGGDGGSDGGGGDDNDNGGGGNDDNNGGGGGDRGKHRQQSAFRTRR